MILSEEAKMEQLIKKKDYDGAAYIHKKIIAQQQQEVEEAEEKRELVIRNLLLIREQK
jgi:hypothetical protein